MNKEMKRLYEGMYVLSASLSEDALKKALERITKTIEASGGEVQKTFEMGRKKLAYEINRHKQGQYILLYFSCPFGHFEFHKLSIGLSFSLMA